MTDYRLTPHERVTVTERTPQAITAVVSYAPGGTAPPAHLHPKQDEHFEVLAGWLTVRVGKGPLRELGPGDVLDIPRGTAHAMHNAGDTPTRVRWRTSPPGRTEAWWADLEAIAARGETPGLRTMARPLREYDDVFRLAVAPRWLLRPMLRVAGVAALLLLTAVAMLTVPVERADAKDVRARFKVSYGLDVSWGNAYTYPPATYKTAMGFRAEGAIPVVTWTTHNEDARLDGAKTWSPRQTVDATYSVTENVPGGTSYSCTGKEAVVQGTLAVAALNPTRAYFQPILGAHVDASCTTTDGYAFPGNVDLLATTNGVVQDGLPANAVDISPSVDEVKGKRWSKPIDMTFTGKECPEYIEGHSTDCTLRIHGTIDAARIDSTDIANPTPQVLRAPKLDVKRKEVRTKVRCTRSCTVDVGIGGFRIGGKTGSVDYDRSSERSVRIKGGDTRTVTTPVPASAQTAVSQGLGVARVTIRTGGKRTRRTYPLGVGS